MICESWKCSCCWDDQGFQSPTGYLLEVDMTQFNPMLLRNKKMLILPVVWESHAWWSTFVNRRIDDALDTSLHHGCGLGIDCCGHGHFL